MLTAAIWAPNLLSLVVGAWVDHQRRKKRLLVVANLIQAAAVAVLPVAHVAGFMSMWLLYAVALVLGAGGVLYQTSYPPFFARLVRRDQYLQANSLLSATRSGSFIAGPALGGLLIQALTAPVAMVVDAVSFLGSALAIGSVKVDEPPVEGAARGARALAAGGRGTEVPAAASLPAGDARLLDDREPLLVRGVRGRHPLRQPDPRARPRADRAGLRDRRGRRARRGGVRVAAGPSRRSRASRASSARCSSALRWRSSRCATGPDWVKMAVLAAVEFVGSVGVMLYDININSIQTAVTPDRMRSRSAGAYATVNYGVRPLGALLGGFMADWVGVPTTLVVAGVGGCLGILWLVRSPVVRIRRVEDLDAVEA